MSHEWLSAHIHFAARSVYGQKCDQVIAEVTAPFTRSCLDAGWIERYFFIRYSEDGPHVRLRLRGDATVLRDMVAPALVASCGAANDLVIRWVPYVPELERYGGPSAMPVAESAFQASSDLAFELLDQAGMGENRSRSGRVLLAMVTLVHAFAASRADAAAIFQSYSRGYRHAVGGSLADSLGVSFDEGYEAQFASLTPYVEEAWGRLGVGASLNTTLDAYRTAMRPVRDALQNLYASGAVLDRGTPIASWSGCVRKVLPSLLHMTSNRLGISIPAETYLAHLVWRVLAEERGHD